MKCSSLINIILLSIFLPSEGGAGGGFLYAQDSLWIRQHYTKKEVMIPMRDGTKLFTAIYAPTDTKEKHPFLMMRTPYSIAPYGENEFRAFWKTHYKDYLKEGYIMVLQDVRGKYMSEGEFVDIRPFIPNKGDKWGETQASSDTNNATGGKITIEFKKEGKATDEASDTYDTIDWLLANVPGNNGRAGVYGISYPGFYATMAALSGHPALKAVSPQAPVTDWYHGDDFHHNGAFMEMDAFGFYSGFGKPRPYPTTKGAPGFKFPTPDMYDFYLKVNTLDSLAKLMGDSIEFWKDMYDNPDYDPFWAARDTRNFVHYIPDSCATLIVGGLFDAEDCFGTWNLYKAIEKNAHNDNRLIMGPWSHGAWARDSGAYLGNIRFGKNTSEYYHMLEEAFFHKNLLTNDKHRYTDHKFPEEANIFMSGENTWISMKEYPSKEIRKRLFYLQSNGLLDTISSVSSKRSDYYTSDPAHPVPFTDNPNCTRVREYMTDDQRFASHRPDVLSYQTPVLEEDVNAIGAVTADLFVSISSTDADFIVKVIDVFPNDFVYPDSVKGNAKNYPMTGYQMLVRAEVMRGRYRNSFREPEPFTPGEITEVKYKLPDISHSFKKGHRIMVQIQSSWFPLVDRNPQQFVNIYKAKPSDFIKTKVHIYHDKDHPSHISFPTTEFCHPK